MAKPYSYHSKNHKKILPQPPKYLWFVEDFCWNCKNRNNCNRCRKATREVNFQKRVQERNARNDLKNKRYDKF